MTTPWQGYLDDSTVTSRISFRFSACGTRAACLATTESGRQQAESWSLRADGPVLDFSTELTCDLAYTMVLPLDGERLLVSRHGSQDTQTLDLLHPDGRLTALGSTQHAPLALLALPAGSPGLALAWSGRDAGAGAADQETALYRVTTGTPWLQELVRLPGRVRDATICGPRILFALEAASGRVRLLVDPRDGTAVPVTFLDDTARVLAGTEHHLLLALRGPQGPALARADLADGSIRALDPGAPPRGIVYPLTLDPTGTTVAVLETVGARSLLSCWNTETGAVQRIVVPEGELLPVAAWTPAGLWLPHSDPRQPRTMAWLPPGAPELHVPTAPVGPWRPGRVESFPGAAGPVEAVVYGPDWRTSRRVVVALHGGPTSHWTLGFNPLFQLFAAAGIAVVAPNQRGSTGYGAEHTLSLVGAWGVPDLADVSTVAAYVQAYRAPDLDRPAVFGISYGGYLALLAAGTRPDLWSGCVAVAPFLSGPRLHAEGFVTVRGMVERLDGLTEATDALGPRDVTRFAADLRGRLLLIHGARDESTPVEHSRSLARQLADLGRREGTDFRYLEPPDRGHAALGAHVQDPIAALVARFLAEGESAADPARELVRERR
ncbi:alpha/beta hydrolase family protein [Kitasatospora azatica]|uniref:alpha/beta hydrolase family protein n=1 Tax=Kitasatospora azatica TaxID=58347 RepID=UPI00056B9A9D|nr:alpha/beta fold hydrolase [Kitasatospora azatica]